MRAPSCVRAATAETLGTFALVFLGTGAIVVDDLAGGQGAARERRAETRVLAEEHAQQAGRPGRP